MNFYYYLKDISKNEHYLLRYLNFINLCKNQNCKSDSNYKEKHHILPVSLFPQFKKETSNIVLLTGRQHFIAHWMLAKLTKSPKMWFAFNQMRRTGSSSILYEYAREEISKAISQANKGKIRSTSHINAIKKSFVGKRPAKNKKTNLITWEDKNDPRWQSGELISPRLGYKHSSETKNKIKNSNKGKKLYQNSSGIIKMFYPSDVPDDFVLYNNPLWHESTVKDTEWYHDPKTNVDIRILKNQKVPKGFIKGRAKHDGFKHINKSKKVKYIDLFKKKYVFLDPRDVDQTKHVRYDGQTIDKIIILVYNNNIVLGKKSILKFLKTQNIYLSYEELKTKKIKMPHHNNSKETLNFRKKYFGKTLNDIGLKIYNLKDFHMKPEYIIKENR